MNIFIHDLAFDTEHRACFILSPSDESSPFWDEWGVLSLRTFSSCPNSAIIYTMMRIYYSKLKVIDIFTAFTLNFCNSCFSHLHRTAFYLSVKLEKEWMILFFILKFIYHTIYKTRNKREILSKFFHHKIYFSQTQTNLHFRIKISKSCFTFLSDVNSRKHGIRSDETCYIIMPHNHLQMTQLKHVIEFELNSIKILRYKAYEWLSLSMSS